MRFTLLAILALLLSRGHAADQWTQFSDFPAQRLHAYGNLIAGWDAYRVVVSNDGGYSWTQPVSPAPVAVAGGIPINVTMAAATPQGPIVLMTNGVAYVFGQAGFSVLPSPPLSGIEVTGTGEVYVQTLDGAIGRFANGAVQPITRGQIYRVVKNGILVQAGETGLSFVGADGVSKVEYKGRSLPPVMKLAPITSPGIDRWVTLDGTMWQLDGRKLVELNRRPVTMMNYFTSSEGYQEYLVYQGQQQISWMANAGPQTHIRTDGMPANTIRVCAGPNSLVAANPQGIWAIAIKREK